MSKNDKYRVTATLDADLHNKLKHFADKKNMSVNDFLRYSIDHTIRFHMGDIDTADLTIGRLNQVIETLLMLTNKIEYNSDITIKGFKSLIDLTRGNSNYLLEDDNV